MKRARIRTGATVGQDFRYHEWEDAGEVFDVTILKENRAKLTAPGYGILGSADTYGCGTLYVNVKDLISVEDFESEEEQYKASRVECKLKFIREEARQLIMRLREQLVERAKLGLSPKFIVISPEDYVKLTVLTEENEYFLADSDCALDGVPLVLVEGAKPRVVLNAFEEYSQLYKGKHRVVGALP